MTRDIGDQYSRHFRGFRADQSHIRLNLKTLTVEQVGLEKDSGIARDKTNTPLF